MNHQGLFKVKLLSAKFPKHRLLGSTDVFLLFASQNQKSRMQGKGYDFESEHTNSKTVLFDETQDLLLKIYGADSLKTIDSQHQVIYGEINLEKLKQQPKVNHVVRVICSQKDEQGLKQNDVGVMDLEIVYYQKMQGQLQITVESAFLTRDTQLVGNMDPYAKLIMGEVIHRTTVKKSAGKTPIWQQKFIFEVNNVNARLEIQIKDQDLTTNDLVGLYDMSLREEGIFSLPDGIVGRALPIYYQKKQAGTVNILTRFTFK